MKKTISKSKSKRGKVVLLMFSEKLNCSLDYLMGLSGTPNKDLQAVKDKTGLSDNAIQYLQDIYENRDIEANQTMIKTLSSIIEDNELLIRMLMYLYGEEVPELNVFYSTLHSLLGNDMPSLSGASLTAILEELAVLKSKIIIKWSKRRQIVLLLHLYLGWVCWPHKFFIFD